MEEKVKYFISASLEMGGCNFNCDYCSVRQLNYIYKKRKSLSEEYPLQYILKAFSPQRLGGFALIYVAGDGETLLPADIEEFILGLLRMGHFVYVTTNGSLDEKIRNIVLQAKREHVETNLMFCLSLHYLELKRLHMLEKFEKMVMWLKANDVNFVVSLVLGPSYIPILNEIKEYCDKNLDIIPTLGLARKDGVGNGDMGLLTELSKEDYFLTGDIFGAQSWDLQKKTYDIKADSYCYAGKWSFVININTGYVSQCLCNRGEFFNFYEKIDEPPKLLAVGNKCNASYCFCGWAANFHLMPQKEFLPFKDWKEYKYVGETLFKQRALDLAANNALMTKEDKTENEMKQQVACLAYAINNNARVLISEKKYEEAINCIEKIFELDINPLSYDVADTIVQYGNCLLELKQYHKALELYSLYNDMNYLADFCCMMGIIFLRNEMLNEAVEMFLNAGDRKTAIQKGTNSYIPKYNLGVICECIGKKDEAVKWYSGCGEYEQAKERLREL